MSSFSRFASQQKLFKGTPKPRKKQLTNAEFALVDEGFLGFCKSANIQPTPRQAGKYRKRIVEEYNGWG